MSYYILPNNTNELSICSDASQEENEPEPFISYSMFQNYANSKKQLMGLFDLRPNVHGQYSVEQGVSTTTTTTTHTTKMWNVVAGASSTTPTDNHQTIEQTLMLMNPYSLLLHNVRSTIDHTRVYECNIKDRNMGGPHMGGPHMGGPHNVEEKECEIQHTLLYYDMIEIIYTLNLNMFYNENVGLRMIHIGNKSLNNYQYLSVLRNNKMDKHFYFPEYVEGELNYGFDYIFYDIEQEQEHNILELHASPNYIMQIMNAILFILKNQKNGGLAIIKIGQLFHKSVVEMLYILTGLFDRVIIMKPSTNNVISFDKYVVCKGFQHNKHNIEKYYSLLKKWAKRPNPQNYPLCNTRVPLYFINKLNELNIILGHKQIENIEQLIYIMKNKYKNDKISMLKKQHILKCINWCKKYKITNNL